MNAAFGTDLTLSIVAAHSYLRPSASPSATSVGDAAHRSRDRGHQDSAQDGNGPIASEYQKRPPLLRLDLGPVDRTLRDYHHLSHGSSSIAWRKES